MPNQYNYQRRVDTQLVHLDFSVASENISTAKPLPQEIGKGFTRVINLADKFKIIHREVIPLKELNLCYDCHLPDGTTVGTFSLNGRSAGELRDTKRQWGHEPPDIHWADIPKENRSYCMPASKRTSMIYICIANRVGGYGREREEDKPVNELLKIFTDRINGVVREGGAVSPVSLYLILDLLDLPLSTWWDWIRLESKALEFLANNTEEHATRSVSGKTGALRPADIKSIESARDILISKMSDPPSISQLARLSGINEFKLKRGFKQVFGTTVYGYLRDYRMETARDLLKSERMNVTQVAFHVGYSNHSAFTAAFRKKYGVLPIQCRKRTA